MSKNRFYENPYILVTEQPVLHEGMSLVQGYRKHLRLKCKDREIGTWKAKNERKVEMLMSSVAFVRMESIKYI